MYYAKVTGINHPGFNMYPLSDAFAEDAREAVSKWT